MSLDTILYYLAMVAIWVSVTFVVVNTVYSAFNWKKLQEKEKQRRDGDEWEDLHHSKRFSSPSGGEERDEWESPQHEDRWTDYSHNHEPDNIFHKWD